MPTYEYVCKDCSSQLEVVQSFSDDALTECPKCHGQLRKVFGNVGIAFKGSGFYKNDSRSSKSSKSESKPAAEKSDSGSSSPASTSSSSDSSSTASTSTSSSDSGNSKTPEAKPNKAAS